MVLLTVGVGVVVIGGGVGTVGGGVCQIKRRGGVGGDSGGGGQIKRGGRGWCGRVVVLQSIKPPAEPCPWQTHCGLSLPRSHLVLEPSLVTLLPPSLPHSFLTLALSPSLCSLFLLPLSLIKQPDVTLSCSPPRPPHQLQSLQPGSWCEQTQLLQDRAEQWSEGVMTDWRTGG